MPRRPLAPISSNEGRETQLDNVTKGFILGMSKTGAKHQEIKDAAGRQKSTIRKVISNDRFGHTKVSKEQRGRPQRLSDRNKRRLFRKARSQPNIDY